jgi:ribosomal protein S18 acetylase RimI-like enzyme
MPSTLWFDRRMIILPYEERYQLQTAQLWLDSWLSTNPAHDSSITAATLSARLQTELAAGWVVYLGWRDHSLVGLLALNPSTRCLEQLFIHPDQQGQGFGTEMLDFAKVMLKHGMWLKTAVANQQARKFYKRHGLHEAERGVHPSLGHETIVYRWN